MGFDGHTERDYVALVAAGVDPLDTQPRERPIPCVECRRSTWNQAGGCDSHYRNPAAVDRALGLVRQITRETSERVAAELEAEHRAVS